MSTAKERFDVTLERCDQLVQSATKDNGEGDECLRFAVVLAVAAFDSYVADRFSEHFVPFLKKTSDRKKAAAFLDGISFGTEQMLELLCDQKDRPFRTIHTAVDHYLETRSFQSEGPIGELFALYGLPKLFGDSVKKAGGTKIEKKVVAMIHRRNEIVHACDLLNNGSPQRVDKKTVSGWIGSLRRLTNAMDEIVNNRFLVKHKAKS